MDTRKHCKNNNQDCNWNGEGRSYWIKDMWLGVLPIPKVWYFSNFSCMFFEIPILFSNLNSEFSNSYDMTDMRNLQEQVKKTSCNQKLFWPFTVRTNCSSDLKNFANSRPPASSLKFQFFFSWPLEHFFLTVGQNNFGK